MTRLPYPLIVAALLCLSGCERADEVSPPAPSAESTLERADRAPVAVDERGTPRQVYWGDLHLHSRYSFDSYSFGNDNLTAEDAFRFARGAGIIGHTGVQAKLARPLDFLLVSDHAEYLGVFVGLAQEDPELLGSQLGTRWVDYLAKGDIRSIVDEYIGTVERTMPLTEPVPAGFSRSVWHALTEAAERHNEPGKFTALIGYEWTSMIDGRNLHRVVVFRDGPQKTQQILPFSAIDGNDPEELWAFLDDYEEQTGGQVLAIPHNGNLSNGLMFAEHTLDGAAFDRDYALTRARWEPVYEMTQVKGDAESHPLLSPADEFADFENWDETDIAMNPKPDDERADMLAHEYARPVLKIGLRLENELGVNPFKFGLIGSTDSHTAFSTADDDNFFGKFPDSEPSPKRLTNKMGGLLWENWRLTASGYAAIWASENTRAALFDALKRREVYASTGPRITVRFFGGWEFSPKDLEGADYADIGYGKGVPMGGDLGSAPGGRAPMFMLAAAKDPIGANLDRVQIVKGWRAESGTLHERVYDVALSDDRVVDDETGQAPPVGNTVDVANASYANSIGADTLAAVWTDPDFDPSQAAFYYARVIEIPTPRWTAYDAKRFGLELPEHIPTITQERAYTSPIWFTP